MKLISLGANKESFHTIRFKDGINIILGKQAEPDKGNDGNTYNGVGKSMTLHLIHFCLGSSKIEEFKTKLPDWEFTLRFELFGKEHYTRRTTKEQNKIEYDGEILKIKEFNNMMVEMCFGLTETPKNMSWNTLFSRFVRRYRPTYSFFDTYLTKESDYSKILNNMFLLGTDIDLIVSKKELRDRQVQVTDTEKALKKDEFFRKYYLGNSDAELKTVELECQIAELEKEIGEFKVSNNYHEIEIDADKKSNEKKKLENRRAIIENNIKNIEESMKVDGDVNEEQIIKIYNMAQVEIPQMVKKEVEDVTNFHKELIISRNNRLEKELEEKRKQLNEIDERISALGNEMDKLLSYLNSHGALEEYLSLTKKLSDLNSELGRIEQYQKLLKSYKDTIREIKSQFIEQDLKTEAYLEYKKEEFEKMKSEFRRYAKRFYPEKTCGLVINNNSGENMLRYNIDAHIENDSSDGINEVRIFCFDMLLFNSQFSQMRFMAHDSRLFANMDHRQRETLFKLVYDICNESNLQYICSINEDGLGSFKDLMDESEYQEIINNNIILELDDKSDESKLLGVKVNVKLEEKKKKKAS